MASKNRSSGYTNVLTDRNPEGSNYFSEIGKEDLLTREQEIELMQKIRAGDQIAYKEMIRKNLRLVVQVAVNSHSNYFGLMDRISEGNLGLIHAIEKFDVTKGFRFSTYAHWWIKQSIERAIMNQGRSVRLPVHVVRALSKYNKACCRITNAPQVSIKEVADELNCDADKLNKMLSDCNNVLYIDQKNDGADSDMSEILADESFDDGIESLISDDFKSEILNALQKLSPYEHFVLVRHMGLIGNDRNTLQEISTLTGCSREQVRNREKNAISKVRQYLV